MSLRERHRVSSALHAVILSVCSIKFVRSIVVTLADCPAPLSWGIEHLAMTSGLSSRRSLRTSGLRPNTICIGETPATECRLFFASSEAPRHSLPWCLLAIPCDCQVTWVSWWWTGQKSANDLAGKFKCTNSSWTWAQSTHGDMDVPHMQVLL